MLAGLIREAALRTQLVVATHADRLIRWLEPSEVGVWTRGRIGSRLALGDQLDRGDWLKKYTLDEL